MGGTNYSSLAEWYGASCLSSDARTAKSPGVILTLLEAAQPADDMSDPAVPNIVIYQDGVGGKVSEDTGWPRFDERSHKGSFFLSRPNFANTVVVDSSHQLRNLSFPLVQWRNVIDEAGGGRLSLASMPFHAGSLETDTLTSILQKLWVLCHEHEAPSRLLERAAGFELIAELCRLSGTPFRPARGGLSQWAKRRSIELMHARLSEDLGLDELAAEVRLSPYHFSRMFKHSMGAPPRVYLTRLRIAKACELLQATDLSVTEIALEVGYASNQALARVFLKHRSMSPTDFRRAVRDPARSIAPNQPFETGDYGAR